MPRYISPKEPDPSFLDTLYFLFPRSWKKKKRKKTRQKKGGKKDKDKEKKIGAGKRHKQKEKEKRKKMSTVSPRLGKETRRLKTRLLGACRTGN